MELGAGYHEVALRVLILVLINGSTMSTQMRALTDALTPALQSIRQQKYYANPRFHASIAWALLDKVQGASKSLSPEVDSICTPGGAFSIEVRDGFPGSTARDSNVDVFPTVSHLPPEDIKILNGRYGSELTSPKVAFDVQSITLKIGKDLSSWKLIG